MSEHYVGKVEHWFSKIHVAGIALTDGGIRVGDTIHVHGHTSDFTQRVKSMQIQRTQIDTAGPGDVVGVEVADHARPGDEVYLVD
jgi:translation elongation factor EF-1alpha